MSISPVLKPGSAPDPGTISETNPNPESGGADAPHRSMPPRYGYGTLHVSVHARSRVQEVYPEARLPEIIRIANEGEELSLDLFRALLQRRDGPTGREFYYLDPGHAGILIVARSTSNRPGDRPWSAVTFIRLSPAQRETLKVKSPEAYLALAAPEPAEE